MPQLVEILEVKFPGRDRCVTFGPYTFDAENEVLRRGEATIPLQHQPAKVLSYLVAHGGRVVTRAELIRHVWPTGHHVDFDRGLNYCIRQVRAALADSAAAPRYLETVPHKGYRWRAPVATSTFEESTASSDVVVAPTRDVVVAPTRDVVVAAWMKPVPVWRAFVATVACTVLTASLAIRLGQPSVIVPGRDEAVVSAASDDRWTRLRVALNALHLMSHALIEPGRRSELPMAIEALYGASLGRTHR